MTTRLRSVSLAGPAGVLEGALQERDGAQPAIVTLVCHPHPVHGGTLHNKVVHRAASTLHNFGAAVLRFNFRGVGKSEGRFDEGEGELEDARAALAWLRARHPHARVWVAGFSFGAWVAARLAASEPGVERVILIAPSVLRSSFESMRGSQVLKLVVQGTADELCPVAATEAEFRTWADPKRLVLVPGATHFFDRKLHDLAAALESGLTGPAQPDAA